MKIFAISDLHLPGMSDKPMNVFGKIWDNYTEKIADDWKNKVGKEDVVLLAGDLSWAMRREDVREDLDFVAKLPGKKVILKGNHDYWWQTISKVREMLPENVFAIQNDALKIGSVIFCGTRGWTCPNVIDFSDDDKKLYMRETERLALSMKAVEAIKKEGDDVVAMMHFPPFNVKRENSNYTDIFEKNGIDKVVYGHLHGKDSLSEKIYRKNGVKYFLTSCDLVSFTLQEIL